MRKSSFHILLAILLLLAGCSQDDIIGTIDTENNQLKKGSTNGMGVLFYGTYINDDSFIPICPPGVEDCGRKLHTNGNFSGNLTGYGKIIPELSKYTIKVIDIMNNPYYGNPLYPREEEWSYKLEIKGKVALNSVDYFYITITGYMLTYEPTQDGRWVYGSVFTGNGKTDTTEGSRGGIFHNYNREFSVKWTVLSGVSFKGINLSTGEIGLTLKLIN